MNKKPITDCKLSIKDLVEGSDNEYRVIAENKAGQSKPSDTTGTFTAKNPFEAPEKPDAPEVTEITENSAILNWKAPADGGSPITNYIIEMKGPGDSKWKRVNKDAVIDTSFTVPDLQEGSEYEFRVTAENKAGPGQPSKPSNKAKYGEFDMLLL